MFHLAETDGNRRYERRRCDRECFRRNERRVVNLKLARERVLKGVSSHFDYPRAQCYCGFEHTSWENSEHCSFSILCCCRLSNEKQPTYRFRKNIDEVGNISHRTDNEL